MPRQYDQSAIYTVDGIVHYPYQDYDEQGYPVGSGEDLALEGQEQQNQYTADLPPFQMPQVDMSNPGASGGTPNPINGDGSIRTTTTASKWGVDPAQSQYAALGVGDFGNSMWWADSVTQNLPKPRSASDVVQRDRGQVRYYEVRDGRQSTTPYYTASVPANDPTYGPDGRIRNESQLAAYDTRGRRFTSANGENLTGDWAALADKFLRSDPNNKSGITTEPITQQDIDLLNKALAAGVIVDAYKAPAAGTPGAAAAAKPGGTAAAGGGTMDPYQKLLADNAAANAANQAAEMAYKNALLAGQADDRARAWAQQTWQQTFSQKQQEYAQSQDAKQYQLSEAGLTGMYNGNPTLQAQLQKQQQALAEGGLTGTYNGAPTLAAQTSRDSTAMSLLNMNAQLTGPQNYLTYLRTLGSTPNGLTDLVNGLAGRFQMPGSAGSNPNAQYQRQSVQGMVNDLNQAPQSGFDLSGAQLPGGTQWNARNVAAMKASPTQWGMTQNLYQESGRSFDEEYAQFLKSLPKYQGSQGGQISLG